MVAPKVWAYVANDSDTNPDLEQYRGYFDLELEFGRERPGGEPDRLQGADRGLPARVQHRPVIERGLERQRSLLAAVLLVILHCLTRKRGGILLTFWGR